MKRLSFFLMFCFLGFLNSLNAQVPVSIGSGDTDCTVLPVEENFKFSISQQIYTAEEMNATPGTIVSVAFKMANNSLVERNFRVYMINTEKESFTHTMDWVNLSQDDMVFDGSVSYPGSEGEWLIINLQTPFEYTGGNILLCVYDMTGTFVDYGDDARFYTYSTGSTPRSLNKASLQYTYDITDMGDVYGNYQGTNPYYNNQVMFNMIIEGVDNNPIAVSPAFINLGERPVGAWMRPVELEISSNVASVNINSIQSSNPFFTLHDVVTPTTITYGNPMTIGVSHGNGSGSQNGQLTITYNSNETEVVELSATTYNPAAPDVWELAETVTAYPHLGMPTFSTLRSNYTLPFGGENGPDAVYKLNLTSDISLTATATGNNAKVVLYPEDFNGKGGPDVDNYYPLQTSAVITDMFVPAGTYYLVASAAESSSSLMVFIDSEGVPAPGKAYNPSPANGATDMNNPELSWNFGDNTVEYQLLFDTQNPPQDVAVAWTSNLQSSFNPGELSESTVYYWRVNARNSSGTTNGDVWSFSTTYKAPTGFLADSDKIYEGDNANLRWYSVGSSCDGYNIYCNGTKVNNSLITGTTYSLSGLTYNMNGYSITATAVYGDVESGHSIPEIVYVSGKANVSGKLFEIDGFTPISGGQIDFVGTDEFGSLQSCTINVNNNGSYSGDVYVGTYTAKASSNGYQNASSQIDVVHGQTNSLDFILYETYYPVTEVVATLTNETSVNVEWSMDRSLESYNVYRRNFHLDDPQLIAENLTSNSYTDNQWGNLGNGAYQWGVAAVYEGNRIEKVILDEDFEKGVMPQNWTTFEEPESDYYITDWAVKDNSYNYLPYEGNYAAYSQGSPSTSLYYMVTDAIDLSLCKDPSLRFHYITPEWGNNHSILHIKVGTSPDGPWTELWSSNPVDVSSWTEVSIDLSDYTNKETYLAFVNENHYSYCVGVDNILIIDNSTESEIVWSNKIDQGMSTTLTVTAETNSGDPATGTTVRLSNMGEGSYYYNVTLDESGTHTWDDFRKGTYEITISKDGFESNYDGVVQDIWEPTEIECILTELLNPIENLYVSPTGWVMWDNNNSKELTSYNIKLNGIFEAEVTTPYYQHDIDGYAFEEGENYTTTVIANYSSGSSAAVKYTWTFSECDNFEGVTDFEVNNVDGNSVLSWTMPDVENEHESDGDNLFYDDGINVDGVGKFEAGPFYWGIMFTADDLAPYVGQKILKVSTYDYAAHDGEIRIYIGGSTAPLTLVHSQQYYCAGSQQYIDFELTESVAIGNENIWITFYNYNGQYVAPAGANTGNPNGRWISSNGVEWYDMYLDTGYDYTWNIRAYVNYEGEYPGMEKDIIGTMIYRDGELITAEPIEATTFTDNISDGAQYSIRVVHGGLPNVTYYSMSCMSYPVSVEENMSDKAEIYPNPVCDKLNITVDGIQRITITNSIGQVVYDRAVSSDNEVIDMTRFEAGVYMIRISTESGVITEKIIK
ncbi:MAG: T9SS type A sorting domain-containing protein [Bacteroidales bacterium]|nr:T9SS type A sorting domain-containing protein [Bacteroidales bacterium]